MADSDFPHHSSDKDKGGGDDEEIRREPEGPETPSFDPNQMPSPEELQKKLSEFMKSNFGNGFAFTMSPPFMGGGGGGGDGGEGSGTGTEEPEQDEQREEPEVDIFEFNLLPRDIKGHLDRYVIKQDDAKKVLSIAVCDHYNHVKRMRRMEEDDPEKAKHAEYSKQNVILIGPTGVGKTYLVKHVAELIGVPFVKADATKFSETGYVGYDVEDLVRELVQKADGDVDLAEYGIVYIDEIDKIASSGGMLGRDVSGRGVQTTLLKLMEETEVPVRSPNDIQAQLQAAMSFGRGGDKQKDRINTRHVLFIVSGAFEKLKEMVEKRLQKGAIGFGAELSENYMDNELFQQVRTGDFIEYGFEPEFVGRLPVRVVCEHLSAEDLYRILKESEGSIIRQYEDAFEAYGVHARFTDEALRRIAEDAAKEKTGARGLLTVTERLLRDFKYELPNSGVEELVISEEVYKDPTGALQKLLEEGRKKKSAGELAGVQDFAGRFQSDHGLELAFTEEAVELIRRQSTEQGRSVRAHCERLFEDYKFGLDLIRRNSGQSRFELGPEAVKNPDGYLSDLVVKSYQKEE